MAIYTRTPYSIVQNPNTLKFEVLKQCGSVTELCSEYRSLSLAKADIDFKVGQLDAKTSRLPR